MTNTHYNKKYFKDRDNLNRPLAETINIFMKDHDLETAIDVGCGTGRLIHYLNNKNYKVKGCDLSKIAVKFANRINNKNLCIVGSATKIPFKNNSFDLVISDSVIEHLTKKEAKIFLKEAARVLKPNGSIFLVTPNFATPIRLFHGLKWFGFSDPTHINFFTPIGLSCLLKTQKFSNIKWYFKTNTSIPFDLEFPLNPPFTFSKFPKPLKKLFIFLLFSTPLTIIRNSFWMSAQKTT